MPIANTPDPSNASATRRCTRCNGLCLHDCQTKTSVWQGGKPYVIERIPALRCASCSEILIDCATAETLRRICLDLPNHEIAGRVIEVPVIAFRPDEP